MEMRRILMIDDEPRILDSLRRRLRGGEFEVEVATNGDDGLRAVQTFGPDLVLSDIMMPGLDGYEVCRRIRSEARYQYVKIILVSGKSSLEERMRGYDAGADDYITKPFATEELLAKIHVLSRLKGAEEINRIKGDLLALFSHETRTPLSAVIGGAETLLRDESLSESSRALAEIIEGGGKRLLEFVRKTTLLCELKSGRTLARSAGSPSDHVEAVVAKLQGDAKDKGVDIAVRRDGGDSCEADWTLIDETLSAVVGNAIKYSPEGGRVTVRLDGGDGTCRIRISDEGSGIAADWAEKIFDEFAIQDVQHHHKGLGLSLAIARHILNAHGGAIEVDSEPNKGTTFTLRLPLPSPAPVPPPPTQPSRS